MARSEATGPSGPAITRVLALAVIALAASGIGTAAALAGSSFRTARTPAALILEVAAALALIAVGILLVLRRRDYGDVVVVLGGAWMLREFVNPEAPGPWAFTIGLAFPAAWVAVLAAICLTYPYRLPDRPLPAWTLVIVAVATMTPPLLRATVVDPRTSGCPSCPENLLLIAPNIVASDVLTRVGGVAGVAACAGVLVFAAIRLARATPAERSARLVADVTTSAAIVVAGVAFVLVTAGWSPRAAAQLLAPAQSVTMLVAAAGMSWHLVRVGAAKRLTARLVSDLFETPRPGLLRDRLASLAHDGTLRLDFPLGSRVIDPSGADVDDPREHSAATGARRTMTVTSGDRPLALITYAAGPFDDRGLREAVADTAGLALEHERLQAELACRVRDHQASRANLVATFDAERRRLERDLHDGAQQRVVALLLQLRIAAERRGDVALGPAIDDVVAVLDELREIAHGLHPAALEDGGLVGALEQVRDASPIRFELTGTVSSRLSGTVETTAYLVVVSLLSSRLLRAVAVELRTRDDSLAVTLRGRLVEAPDPVALERQLEASADRVGALGGAISCEFGGGELTIWTRLPCEL